MSRLTESSLTLTNALLKFREPMVMTDAAGRFSVPADTSVEFDTIFVLPSWLSRLGTTNSALWAGGTLVFRRQGYESKLVPVFAKRTCDVGTIELQPTQP